MALQSVSEFKTSARLPLWPAIFELQATLRQIVSKYLKFCVT